MVDSHVLTIKPGLVRARARAGISKSQKCSARGRPRGRFSEGLISRAPARAYFQNAQNAGARAIFFIKFIQF